jgi:hypothetical protein
MRVQKYGETPFVVSLIWCLTLQEIIIACEPLFENKQYAAREQLHLMYT